MNKTETELFLSGHETPLFVYDLSIVKKNAEKLRRALGDSFKLYYSVKANPNPQLLNSISNLTDGMECASAGEIKLGIEAGTHPQNILFVGPGKKKSELEYAVNEDIGLIVVESVREAQIVDLIAMEANKVQDIAIRINVFMKNKGARMKMGGEAKPFGIDEDQLLDALKRVDILKGVRIIGIYTYNGTQILQAEDIARNFQNTFRLAVRSQEQLGRPFSVIGVGGGYGVPYFENDQPLELRALKTEIASVVSAFHSMFTEDIRIISEAGRYLVAECGFYIARVLYKKQSRDKVFLILDGGTNFYSIASGLKSFLRRNLPVYVWQPRDAAQQEKVTLVGPLCTPTDILSQDIMFPVCKEGDTIIFPKAGAYGYSASPVLFLSHERPCELVVESFLNEI